jgi:hypothetical protein
MERPEKMFDALGKAVSEFERTTLVARLKEVEASKFIGADGKEYYKIPPPRRYAKEQ